MTLALNAETLDEIRRRQAEIRPIKTLLTLVTALFFAVGWTLYQAWAVLWAVFAWSSAAVAVGWTQAHEARQGTG